jgi:uncharacterized protein (TIGR02246 family)
MADLAERIGRLEDIETIRNLIASYGPAADRGDGRAAADIWWPDGEYDVGGFGTAKGWDAIAALFTGDTHRALIEQGCAHVLSPHKITINGTSAEASGYSAVFLKTDTGFEAWRVSYNEWKFEKRDGEWRATLRVNRPVARHPQ